MLDPNRYWQGAQRVDAGNIANDPSHAIKMRNQSKWEEYGTYENWKRQNYDELKRDYNACWYEREQEYQPPSFDEYCVGTWQRL